MDLLKFILVGVANTAFGYGVYVGLNYIFLQHSAQGYMIALVLGNIITITTNFICYKLFVFQTRGNYLQEYCRFWTVYAASFTINALMLPIFVEIFGLNTYLAGAVIIPITVIFSFIGHSRFSFARKRINENCNSAR